MTDAAHPRRRARIPAVAAALVALLGTAVGLALWTPVGPAAAHDSTTTASAHVERRGSHLVAELELEYDLLMKSAWLYAEAYEATGRSVQLAQLAENADAVDAYVTARFVIDAGGERCVAERERPADIREASDRAFAVLRYRYDCGAGHGDLAVSSALFPDAEGFVHDTQTLVTWNSDGERGSGLATEAAPTLELSSAPGGFGEFLLLGAHHLLIGPDHLLFLVALLLGARNLRGVVIAATTFTVAHSVTLLLAGTGLVTVPAAIVEPVIALSIAAVAAAAITATEPPARYRVPIVFAFGLLHGLGFAGALGIEEPWSWNLLASLLAFNLGIELVQLALIAVAFPLLVRVRRTGAGAPATRIAGVLVAAVGLVWFAERVITGSTG